jgi:AcrR family transcriptional regulator
LVRDGYDAMTTTRVAKVAGVSIGSLYQYFPTKEALVAALVDDHIAKILALLGEAAASFDGGSLDATVRAFVRAVLRAHAVDPDLHAVLTSSFSQVQGFEKVRELNARAEELVAAFLEHAQGRGDSLRPKNLRLAAFVLVHAVQSVVTAAVRERQVRLDDDELADELTALVLGFLGGNVSNT